MSVFLLAPGDLLRIANDTAMDLKAAAGEVSVSRPGEAAPRRLGHGAVAGVQAKAVTWVLALTEATVEFPEAARAVFTLLRSGKLPAPR